MQDEVTYPSILDGSRLKIFYRSVDSRPLRQGKTWLHFLKKCNQKLRFEKGIVSSFLRKLQKKGAISLEDLDKLITCQTTINHQSSLSCLGKHIYDGRQVQLKALCQPFRVGGQHPSWSPADYKLQSFYYSWLAPADSIIFQLLKSQWASVSMLLQKKGLETCSAAAELSHGPLGAK